MAIAAVVLIAMIASQALQTSRPAPTHGVADATTTATRPTVTVGPTPSAEAWEAMDLAPVEVMASLSPIRSDRTGVQVRSGFSLVSRNGVPAVELARGLVASPAIRFRVVPGKTADEAIIRPSAPLEAGRTYRFRLTDPSGVLGGSWAFRTQQPLRVLYTLPEDRSAEVPVDTGIELTFDQDGATGVASRLHIDPPLQGRVEEHDRTWSFVPDSPLRPATAYTVTLDAGVGLTGAAQVLEQPVTFRFETEATVKASEPDVDFGSALSAIRPGQQPAFFINVASDKVDRLPDQLRTQVYRLPTLGSAMSAAATLTGPDSWLRASGKGLVSTDGLVRVASLDAPVGYDEGYGTGVLTIPIDLDPGAYLVVIPRAARPAQALLQVSDLSAYALSSRTSTMVWVNDLATVASISGATIRWNGATVATTGTDGIATFPTATYGPVAPNGESEATPRLLSVRAEDGRWLVAALGSQVSWLEGSGNDNNVGYGSGPSERYWLFLHTERTEYRPSDTIHVSGLVRPRDASVPGKVELRLRPSAEWDEDTEKPAIAVVPVTLGKTGAFLTDIAFTQLPYASYRVDLVVDGAVAERTWLQVADIRKPSFRIDVETDRRVYLVGDQVTISVHATFFDGTDVPHMDLAIDGDKGQTRTVTTDANGTASTTVRARQSDEEAGSEWSGQYIRVTPVGEEEGEIAGYANVLVLPSSLWLATASSLTDRTLAIRGVASHADLAAIDRAAENGSDVAEAAAGAPWAARSINLQVVQHHAFRTKTGTHYDFFEKKVVPVYEYDTRDIDLGTSTLTSRSDGSFELTVTVPSATDSYSVVIRAEDAAGREARREPYASPAISPRDADRPSYLLSTGDCGFVAQMTVGVDSAAKVTLHDGDGHVASDGRFLFLVGRQGIEQIRTGTSPTFSRTLESGDLPGFTIRAVQLTGAGYVSADARVEVSLDDLEIKVLLDPTRARYAPGDHVRVKVTTLGPDGHPIAADVLVSGVDEKLYAIGGADDLDVLSTLYAPVSNGFLQSFTSHRRPVRPFDGGCGDAGGGRESFADVVTSQLVHTGGDGTATVDFDLSDDLTSWHLSATAVTRGLLAGRGSVLVPVSLPFFVESVLAPEYLVGESVILPLRAYGTSLHAADDVTFTVSAPTLGLTGTTVKGKAFAVSHVTLPALTVGTHRIRVAAKGPDGVEDAVIREIRVISTRLATLKTTYDELTPGYAPRGDGDGLTTYLVVDAGRGQLLSTLSGLAGQTSGRFDRLAAADAARRILIDDYGLDPDELPAPGFEPSSFQRSGIAAVPYGGPEPELTALAALIVPERLNQEQLRNYFMDQMSDATRETKLLALTGLAALGDDELAALLEFVDADLTVREQLWLGLGLVAAGDETTARTVERRLLEAHGEQYGPWVRLRVGKTLEDSANAARLLLVLSARLGEPFAPAVLRYLDHHDSVNHTTALERLAYVEATLERLPRSAGRFAWSVDGTRHVEDLRPGGSYELTLTASQRASLVLEPLDGSLEVVTSWRAPGGQLPSGGDLTITRSITPATGAVGDQLVQVTFTVTFGGQAEDGCWILRETLPSGLAPVRGSWYGGSGQFLTWCKTNGDEDRTVSYLARVITPGTYLWEPAVIQSDAAPELGSSVPALTYTIGT